MRNSPTVSFDQFRSAHKDVQTELRRAGLNPLYSRLYQTDVVWCRIGTLDVSAALGFFINQCHPWERLFGFQEGNIYIPQWVLAYGFWRNRGSLRDVIRHEYGHALVYHYPEFFGKKFGFTRLFARAGTNDDDFVSEYAQTDREEDFCAPNHSD